MAALSSNDIWAVGYSQNLSTFDSHAFMEHWDGSIWKVGFGATLESVPTVFTSIAALAPDNVWVVGSATQNSEDVTLVEHWDGSIWSVAPSPNPSDASNTSLNTIAAVAPDNIWAIGAYTGSDGYGHPFTEHWNGSSWTMAPGPDTDNSGFTLRALAANDIWAIGSTGAPGSPSQPLIEHWDGSAWTITPSPSPGSGDSNLLGVTALAANNIWAVGEYSSGGSPQPFIEHWHGSAWTITPSPTPGSGGDLYGVAALAPNNIWAVGDYRDAQDASILHTLIEHWDGFSWTVVSSPNPSSVSNNDSFADVIVLGPDNAWVVGRYDTTSNATSPSGTLFEHWNGSSWSIVPSPNAI